MDCQHKKRKYRNQRFKIKKKNYLLVKRMKRRMRMKRMRKTMRRRKKTKTKTKTRMMKQMKFINK
jgi:hypothetical protein